MGTAVLVSDAKPRSIMYFHAKRQVAEESGTVCVRKARLHAHRRREVGVGGSREQPQVPDGHGGLFAQLLTAVIVE